VSGIERGGDLGDQPRRPARRQGAVVGEQTADAIPTKLLARPQRSHGRQTTTQA